jgi:hypothetical protein
VIGVYIHYPKFFPFRKTVSFKNRKLIYKKWVARAPYPFAFKFSIFAGVKMHI